MSVEIRDNFLMGTENGPDGSKHTVRYDIWVGGSFISLYTKEQILAFAEWVRTSGDYMEDVAQQANGWVTPSGDHNPLKRPMSAEEIDQIVLNENY